MEWMVKQPVLLILTAQCRGEIIYVPVWILLTMCFSQNYWVLGLFPSIENIVMYIERTNKMSEKSELDGNICFLIYFSVTMENKRPAVISTEFIKICFYWRIAS
jgi:hypothetical protein